MSVFRSLFNPWTISGVLFWLFLFNTKYVFSQGRAPTSPIQWCYTDPEAMPCHGQKGRCTINADGSLGGFVAETAYVQTQKSTNRNQPVIEQFAEVCDRGQVSDQAKIRGHARVYDDATVRDDAELSEHAEIFGNGVAKDHSKMADHSKIFEDGEISANSEIGGNVRVYRKAKLSNHSRYSGNEEIFKTNEWGYALLAHTETETETETSLSQQVQEFESLLFAKAHPEQVCQYRLLKELGWTFPEKIASNTILESVVETPSACQAYDLNHAHQLGLLTFPSYAALTMSLDYFLNTLPDYLSHPESFCAYKMKVSKGAISAARKLSSNPNYEFKCTSESYLAPPSSSFQSISNKNKLFAANTTPAKALECYFHDKCSSECSVGRQVIEYLTVLETYGQMAFDQAFKSEEIILGCWTPVFNTKKNPFYLDDKTAFKEVPMSFSELRLGAHALTGVSGYIGNVKGESFLDQSEDRGENFLIVQATQAAANQILEQESLGQSARDKFNLDNYQIWKLSKKLSKSDLKKILKPGIKEFGSKNFNAIREILNQPFFKEIKIYVHPMGVMSFAQHIVRLLEVNPKTPYYIRFDNDQINSGIYEKYKNSFIDHCVQSFDRQNSNSTLSPETSDSLTASDQSLGHGTQKELQGSERDHDVLRQKRETQRLVSPVPQPASQIANPTDERPGELESINSIEDLE